MTKKISLPLLVLVIAIVSRNNGNAFQFRNIITQKELVPRVQSSSSKSAKQQQQQHKHKHKQQHLCASPSSSSWLDEDLSKDEISRYSRHLVLSDVGMVGQRILKNSSVLVVGAGGLGSPCLLYLAAAGVGHIGIVDADTVDSSNLQRQIIHGTSTVGHSKCQSAKQRILDINPFVHVQSYEMEFTSQTALEILGNGFEETRPYDLVIDGSDNFPTKYLINDACAILHVPWIYSAILGFEGQLSVFNWKGGPDYRDLLPTPPPPGDVPSCAEGGVLGVLPGTMGCLQATEAIKMLLLSSSSSSSSSSSQQQQQQQSSSSSSLGRRKTPDGICSGRVLIFDALKMKFSEVGLEKEPDREPIIELIDYQGFCGGPQTTTTTTPQTSTTNSASTGGRTMDEEEFSNKDIEDGDGQLVQQTLYHHHTIEPKEALDKLKTGWCPWVLDVRLQTEHDIVALPFTDRITPHRIVRSKDVPSMGDVLVYCKAGIRGKKACDKLIEQGIDPDRLYNMKGGILKWQEQVDPSMPRY